jgi:8-oxo-dGTP diphosphatase
VRTGPRSCSARSDAGSARDAWSVRAARGTLDYRFPFRPSWSQVSDVFVCRRWQGEPSAGDELDPRWVPVDAVPYDAMWDDARYWLPGVLAGGRVDARVVFAEDDATVAGFTGTGIGEPA